MSAPRELRMIYREIPPSTPCKAGCADCCGPVPWSDAELARVQADIPAAAGWIEIFGTRVLENPLTKNCPFVVPGGGCAVYDRRPFFCRLFGASDDPLMQCPHGCAAKKPLSVASSDRLHARYVATDKGAIG